MRARRRGEAPASGGTDRAGLEWARGAGGPRGRGGGAAVESAAAAGSALEFPDLGEATDTPGPVSCSLNRQQSQKRPRRRFGWF